MEEKNHGRLNVEIENNGKSLANAYYHWSAYTGSALYLTQQIIDAFYDLNNPGDDITLDLAIKLLEATGAGVNPKEKQRIEDAGLSVAVKDCTDRNEGLLSITEEGKDETRCQEEGRVTIDLGTQTGSKRKSCHFLD